MATVPIPTTLPSGKPAGQVRPRRVIDRRVPLSEATGLWQETHQSGNVCACGVWMTDGKLSIDRFTQSGSYRKEWVRITGGTYAFYITWVEIGGQQVSHPMVWMAYGQTQADRQLLEAKILPLYRCMSQNTPRMFWRNFYQLNGGWTHTPGNVYYASKWPYRVDPHYVRHHYGKGPYPVIAD